MITRSRSAKKLHYIKSEMGEIDELREIVETIRKNMATNDKIDEFIKILAEKDAKISQLEERIKFLEQSNSLLEQRVNDKYILTYASECNMRYILRVILFSSIICTSA